MRVLVFDPFSGVSGDMTLGALVDLGLAPRLLEDLVAELGQGRIGLRIRRVQRRGIACTKVDVEAPPETGHRHLGDVLRWIEATSAPPRAKERAAAVFQRLAEAEAAVHGTTPDRVHFHEVGAIDAVVDILGACTGIEALGVERVYTRPVALGRGWTTTEHGTFPVPPPAVLKLLEGVPVRDDPLEGECTTPTGAALVRVLTDGRSPPPELRPRATGFGAGTRDPADYPNCLRLLLAEEPADGAQGLWMLVADLDDLPGEYLPPLLEAARQAGAIDASAHPLLMKKGRLGVRVEALAPAPVREAIAEALFHASSTLGVRAWPVERTTLERRIEEWLWRGHTIRVKRCRLPDGSERAKPEFEDVARAAAAEGMTPWAAYQALLASSQGGPLRADEPEPA